MYIEQQENLMGMESEDTEESGLLSLQQTAGAVDSKSRRHIQSQGQSLIDVVEGATLIAGRKQVRTIFTEGMENI